MSDASDFLRTFVDGLPDKIDSLNKSYQSITAQINDLEDQQEAIEDGVLAVIVTELTTNVLLTKATSAHVYTFGNFGGYDSSGNAEDWEVYGLINNTGTFTQVSAYEFVLEGVNITGQLSATEEVVVTNNGTFSVPATTVTVQVTGAPYPANSTYVQVDGSIVGATIDGVWVLTYEYEGTGWDSDATVQGYIDSYAFAIDHIHAALGTDGTYGIIALGDALTQGKNIIYKNLVKTQGMETTYEDFAT